MGRHCAKVMLYLHRINKFWRPYDSLGSRVKIAVLNTWNFLRLDIKYFYHRETIWKHEHVSHLDDSNHDSLNWPLKWGTCWRPWKWPVQLQLSFLIQWGLQAGHYSLCDTVCGIFVSVLGWSGWSYIELRMLCTPMLWLVKAEGPTILKIVRNTTVKSLKKLCTALDTVF